MDAEEALQKGRKMKRGGDPMLIELTRGKYAIIDAVDADLAGRSWHAVPGIVL